MNFEEISMLFYDDELEHYQHTARSLILTTLNTREEISAELQLRELVERLEQNNVSAEELADFTSSKLIRLVTEASNEAALTLAVPADIQADDIKNIAENIKNSIQLTELIKNLNGLPDAVLNKQDYLFKNAKYLSENESEHKGDWFGNSRLTLAIKRGEVERAKYFIEHGLYCQTKICWSNPVNVGR